MYIYTFPTDAKMTITIKQMSVKLGILFFSWGRLTKTAIDGWREKSMVIRGSCAIGKHRGWKN